MPTDMPTDMPKVVTRFAPSPTGFLHIGGARTALYNWLFAKRNGGDFLLRIEDTDRKRSSDEAVDAILSGMNWLGLDHTGDVISQFARADRHRQVAEDLLSAGKAYKCYATQEELAALREESREKGLPMRGDIWRERDPSQAPEGVAPAIRLKMNREGATTICDQVQGDVTVQNDQLDDMIILRADGSPTYMLSVVVDDHDMGITHIIRGDDHLNNAFRQMQLFEAMGWDAPIFAHIPLIHGPDGKKLSKRHGALGVDGYDEMGYLPEAMRNYLLRLGWSHGDDELITTDQAIAWFNMENLGKSPSRLDFDKLDSVNAHYIQTADSDVLIDWFKADLATEIEHAPTAEELAQVKLALSSARERAKKRADLAEVTAIFCNIRPLTLTEKAAKAVAGEIAEILSELASTLENLSSWEQGDVKQSIFDFAESKGMKMGKVMQPIRAALTGGRPSGDLMEIMEILGKEECILRLQDIAAQ
ncbi:glutamate--tRNA ligase [Temperatibacter marinus]|uniref:Glutamate--tRNA ligase n=1 Tax=Temperatibacter marinus TaxID=1456591 RepID=A0AA52H8R1_9PROT|nr:glutamate--tRNA ligase [Temperatibacter marinus]WND02376.1 glutamate--tRNA ligase [Temperatibacter marinus]